MRIKTQTNVQLVKHMMEHSSQGALMQAFIIEAIRKYAELTSKAPDWDKEAFISQAAWKACAQEAMAAIDNR
jgi:hypothetical protein